MKERMKILNKLWDSGFNAEHSYKSSPKLLNQFQHAEEHGIPFSVIIGSDELNAGCVKIRETSTREETVSLF